MSPTTNRTIYTSKTTGRRYYLGRSANRSNSRRYYICSNPDCDGRVARESDLYCRAHSQAKDSDQTDDVDESIINENSEIIDEDISIQEQDTTTNNDESENETNGSIPDDDLNNTDTDVNNSSTLSAKHKAKANRDIQIDEITGARTFRDNSGRRRYLCREPSCTNMLKRQNDLYCGRHTIKNEKKNQGSNHNRHSTPPTSNETKKKYRSPFENSTSPKPTTTTTTTTTTTENGTNGNHSEEYESPEKIPEPTGTPRSFRDASGKIRFLCSNPSCNSRIIRRSDVYCKRHQLDNQVNGVHNNGQSYTTDDSINPKKEDNHVQEMDVNHNNSDTVSRRISSESSNKKRKRETEPTISEGSNLSIIPANKMVLSTTTLLDEQWTDILTFLRQYPDARLSTNLNVNNMTTHLLVDDSEKPLHCTITKKIVQAAVRHHIYIISTRWINECIKSNKFVDEHPYEIQTDSHTALRLSSSTDPYLFNDTYGFAIECRQCQGSINRNELIELIQLTGAKFYEKDNNNINLLIVLCDTNDNNFNRIKEKYQQSNIPNIKYVTSDFLLKSIIKFEIQEIDKYTLEQ